MKSLYTLLIILSCSISYAQSARTRAEQLFMKKDIRGAIAVLDKAIAAGEGGDIYFDRGNYKFELSDYSGAISDYEIAIKTLNSYTKWIAVMRMGQSKHRLKNYTGAIADYNSIITSETKISDLFYHRALSKIALGDKDGACADLSKAKNLSNYMIKSEEVFATFNKNCSASSVKKSSFYDVVRVRALPQPKTTDRISRAGDMVAKMEVDPLDNSRIINTPTCDVLAKSVESFRREDNYAYMSADMAYSDGIYYLVIFLNESVGCLNKNESELKVELVNGQTVTFTMVGEKSCGGYRMQFVPINKADMSSPNFRDKIKANIDLLASSDWKKIYMQGTEQKSQWGSSPGKAITLIPALSSDLPDSNSNRLPNPEQFFKKYIAAIKMKM